MYKSWSQSQTYSENVHSLARERHIKVCVVTANSNHTSKDTCNKSGYWVSSSILYNHKPPHSYFSASAAFGGPLGGGGNPPVGFGVEDPDSSSLLFCSPSAK